MAITVRSASAGVGEEFASLPRSKFPIPRFYDYTRKLGGVKRLEGKVYLFPTFASAELPSGRFRSIIGLAMAALVPLAGMVVLRVVVLNGIAGVVFGHLYWTRGLEAAMLAHFSADIMLHVLIPLFLG